MVNREMQHKTILYNLVNSPPQAQLESPTREVLAGLVERVTFHRR